MWWVAFRTSVTRKYSRLFRLGCDWALRKRVALIIPLLKFSKKISEPRGQRSLNGVLHSEVLPDCVGDAALQTEWNLAKPDRWRFLEWNRAHVPSDRIVQSIDRAQSPVGESERAINTRVPGCAEMWHRTSLMEVHILKRFTVEIVPLTAWPLEWNCRKNQRRANLSQHSGRRQLQGKGSCLLSLVRSYRQPVAGSFRCTSAFWCVPQGCSRFVQTQLRLG
jgi:hypothetical protein